MTAYFILFFFFSFWIRMDLMAQFKELLPLDIPVQQGAEYAGCNLFFDAHQKQKMQFFFIIYTLQYSKCAELK